MSAHSSECSLEDLSVTSLGACCCRAGGTAQLPEQRSSAGAFAASGRSRSHQGARGPAHTDAAGMSPGRSEVILDSSSVELCLSRSLNWTKGVEMGL